MMKEKEIREMFSLAGSCSYNADNKREFRRLALKFLRELRSNMVLNGETAAAEIRFNPGGIAVSGDAILHAENMYLTFNADGIGGHGIMYRKCNGLKDYGAGTGTPNHWVMFETVAHYGIEWLARKLRGFLATNCKPNNMRCEVHGFTTV